MIKSAALLRCLVVEDEPLALALLSDYIGRLPQLQLVKATSDPMEGLAIATAGAADLIFLDMQMPALSGLQFLKVLQQRTPVIITTAYSNYALDGYEHDVVDYLLKPITFERFMIAVEKSQERSKHPMVQEPAPALPYLFVKIDYRQVKVFLDDIYYLEGARDYVVIHTKSGQLLTLESLKSLENKLPAQQFMRIHKSYLIALGQISFIERSRVSVAGQLLPVSDSFKPNLQAHVQGQKN